MAYPKELVVVLAFHSWISDQVGEDLATGVHVDDMATTLAFPPTYVVLNLNVCMAFGNPYRVAIGNVEQGFMTFDNGIALIVFQSLRTSTAYKNIIEAHLSYVGGDNKTPIQHNTQS